jgi:hypothetical protein
VATTRRAEAEQERVWASVAAPHAGLSIRQLAAATGRSRSRIHQLLQDTAARAIPTWLSQLRTLSNAVDSGEAAAPAASQARMQVRVAAEVEVLRWWLDWLERLARGEQVVVHLRPAPEEVTESVQFDQARVRRVLARIAADLDTLARHDPEPETARPAPAEAPRRQPRDRLAVPEERPRRGRPAKEQREALRQAFGLPHYDGDYADSFRHLQGPQA